MIASMPRAPTVIRPRVSASPMTAPGGVDIRPKTPASPMAVAEAMIARTPRRWRIRRPARYPLGTAARARGADGSGPVTRRPGEGVADEVVQPAGGGWRGPGGAAGSEGTWVGAAKRAP